MNNDHDMPNTAPFWRCEECGHESHTRPMPTDRAAFYAKLDKGIIPKCPACHSEAFLPRGF